MTPSLLEKYSKLEFKPHPDGTLFAVDKSITWKMGRCYYANCGNKLHESKRYPGYLICGSNKHKWYKIKKVI